MINKEARLKELQEIKERLKKLSSEEISCGLKLALINIEKQVNVLDSELNLHNFFK